MERKVRKLAQEYSPEAIYSLVGLMRGAKSEKVRHDAAVSLLDRALGRPFQALDPGEDEDEELLGVSDAVIEAIMEAETSGKLPPGDPEG